MAAWGTRGMLHARCTGHVRGIPCHLHAMPWPGGNWSGFGTGPWGAFGASLQLAVTGRAEQ